MSGTRGSDPKTSRVAASAAALSFALICLIAPPTFSSISGTVRADQAGADSGPAEEPRDCQLWHGVTGPLGDRPQRVDGSQTALVGSRLKEDGRRPLVPFEEVRLGLAFTRAEASSRAVEDVLAEDTEAIPMRRIGTPEEFANVVLFLAAPAASYVTGVTLQVDGGTVQGLL